MHQLLVVIVLNREGLSHCDVVLGGLIGGLLVEEKSSNQVESIVKLRGFEYPVRILLENKPAFSQEQGHYLVGSVGNRAHLPCFIAPTRQELVPVGLSGEVDVSAGLTFIQNGGAHELWSQHELGICDLVLKSLGVLWKLEEEGFKDRAQAPPSHKVRVVELEKRIPEPDVVDAGLQGEIAERIGLLVMGLDIVVVASEGIEGAQLEPPGADLISRIAPEPTNITPNHLDSPQVEHEVG